MSEESVNNTQPRNDNNEGQIGVDQGNQIMAVANPPPPPPVARRILMIQRNNDIVGVLSNLASSYGQAIQIFNGMGYVREAILTALPSLQQLNDYDVRFGGLVYLSGWFLPVIMDTSAAPLLFSRPNGILHASVVGIPYGASIATRLIVSALVEVYVLFVCGPGTTLQPDALGAEPIRIYIQSPIANNPPPPVAPTAVRILMIQSAHDVVSVLSLFSQSHRQPIYILSGVGYVTQVILTVFPSHQQLIYPNDMMEILNLTGWFQPTLMNSGHGSFSRPNGILHVSLFGGPPGASIAQRLIVLGCVEVYVVCICGPGSVIPPDALGAEPIRLNIPSPLHAATTTQESFT